MKGMDYRKTFEQIVEHVRLQGYFVATDKEPSREVRMAHEKVALVAMRGTGYNGTRTSMDLPIAQEVIRAAESAAGPVIKLPTMGGAVPLEMIEQAQAAPPPDPMVERMKAAEVTKTESEAVKNYALDSYYDKALSLVLSGKAREAFNLSAEDDATRELYGRNTFGQSSSALCRVEERGLELAA